MDIGACWAIVHGVGHNWVRHNWTANTLMLHLVYRIKLCKLDRNLYWSHAGLFTGHLRFSNGRSKLKGLDHFYPQNIPGIGNDVKAWTKDDSEPPWPLSRVKAQGWCKWCWQPMEGESMSHRVSLDRRLYPLLPGETRSFEKRLLLPCKSTDLVFSKPRDWCQNSSLIMRPHWRVWSPAQCLTPQVD